MRAIVHHRHGRPEVLECREVPDPEPESGEVVVAVRAAGINRLDVLQRQGPSLIPRFELPHVPGMDVAGVVVALGSGVTTVSVGDRVLVKPGVHCGACEPCRSGNDARCLNGRLIGGNRPGGYAELCVVPATHVFAVPDHISDEHAATIATACSTAWRGLVNTGQIAIGETVLIHAAGSGVSTYAIQIARRAGATVFVTSRSDAKLERAVELGATAGFNSSREDIGEAARAATGGRGVDMVFDHVGPALFEQSVGALRAGGRLVFCGTTTGPTATLNLPRAYHGGLSFLGVPSQSYAEFVAMLDAYWHLGLDAVIDCCMPLDAAAKAHARLEGDDTFGKIVLQP